ncbi:FAD-dependent oxidoreductase [Zooshikella ganghwensis]|uniref:FAD-dependent oxidoreductase n=1 Tax=Zooshikella ganghwensis TaxID=202772 RepID=A0A4P9VSC4_9GAMM|nr:FAD-dependent oxidoreductase [Zooshikella ganghwensis]RDH46523.1 FAD-dependent oxidoreductase [Zooshikella ganghwensis]
MQQQYDIIIIGAGMVGTTLALALSSKGFRIALVEKQPYPEFDPLSTPDLRVSALSQASIRILKHVGAWPHILAMRACPYNEMAVWEQLAGHKLSISGSRLNKTLFSAKQAKLSELGYIIENNIIQRALHLVVQKQTTLDLFCPAHIEQFILEKQNPIVQLSDQTQLTANLLVGADGASSAVRQAANIGIVQSDYEQHAFVITVALKDGPQQHITWQAFTPTGPLAFLPLPRVNGKNYASLVWYNHPETIEQLKQLNSNQLLRTIQQSFPEELPALEQIVATGSFPLTKRHARTYSSHNTVLIGDAAHTINPLAGQGANLGFMDAAVLADSIINEQFNFTTTSISRLLSIYEKRRRPDNTRMMHIMDMFYYLFSNNKTPLKLIRNTGLTLANLARPFHKPVIKYASGLSHQLPASFQ